MDRLPRLPLSTKQKNLEVKNKIMKKFAAYGTCSLYLYGAPHVDFLDCERLLLPGVTLHLRLYRSPNLCALESLTDLDADAVKSLDKNLPVVVIEKASPFVKKIVLADTVKLSIKRALTKSCAVDPYIENSTKSFIIQSGQICFVKENIFGTEPIRRLTMCMVRNRFFRGTTTASTPFSYQKFDLQKGRVTKRKRFTNSRDAIGYIKRHTPVLQYHNSFGIRTSRQRHYLGRLSG